VVGVLVDMLFAAVGRVDVWRCQIFIFVGFVVSRWDLLCLFHIGWEGGGLEASSVPSLLCYLYVLCVAVWRWS